uniref:Minor capsid protein L2 n=1 Tax=Human papillomavirus TaxID=10566 RepID=A0A192B6N4_9PAPI|nr:L2 [Human papillomavirus]
MYRAGRNKRASAEDLYKQCGTGDCPEDVRRKIEGDTWADRLLKWFGSFVYFGGLGIGTGRGSGGSTGYRPLGGTQRPVTDTIPVRPAVPLDPVGPIDIIPIDPINPTGSSVIELAQLPDPSVIDIGNPTTNLDAGEIDVISATDPISDVTGASGQPTVVTTANEDVAILEVQPVPPPKRFALDVQNSPTSTHITVYSATTHPDPDINIFIDSQFDGEVVGDVEEIPLEPLNRFQEFEIEETPPKSSTPVQVLERFAGSARRLYNRYTEQVLTRNPNFLGSVSRAVQFEFSNPAFEPDVTMQFEADIAEIAAAPDYDFRDIQTLHRPQYSVTADGNIRVSRLGYRSAMTTRSGLQVGRPVHFYQDISPIKPTDFIEMQSLNTTSHSSTLVDTLSSDIFVNPVFDNSLFNEEDLLDPLNERFENAHLIITGTDEFNETYQVPISFSNTLPSVFIDDIGDIYVVHPNTFDVPNKLTPSVPVPSTLSQGYSDDYFLHPSLYRKKRKRSDMF